ncbi:sensor histidine kinase [Roseovarius sp. S1116L3]|uniref:sensor histidine kinase n=1 Tax=Roseovarius roseus TaxID=3342636 RepID=UPI003728A5EE
MKLRSFYRVNFHNPKNLFLLNAKMRDYAHAGIALFPQRVIIYCAAFLLEGFYYSWKLAALSLSILVVSELFDYLTFKSILNLKSRNISGTKACMKMLVAGTTLSALNIAGFAVSIALLQGHTTHFMSLFFLIAAALFATMNNNQITSILHLRLLIYLAAFLFIPIYDILAINAPLSSELWVQLFACIFAMFFISDASRVSSGLYQKTLLQMMAIKREHQKTKAAYTAKAEFLATVSHELRTPLTSIKGTLDLLAFGAYGEMPDRMANAITIAQRNSKRLAALINDLLDLQKMEAGQMQFHFEKVHLAPFITQAVATHEPFAAQLDVSLKLEHVPNDMYVTADPDRLDQVLANILSNAAKFSDSGETVKIQVQGNGTTVRIAVVDRGIGLDESDRQKVFEEFSQLDSSDQRKIGGTGLGMNISKRIIEAHEGTLDYYKNEDKGTTFYIDLALVKDCVSQDTPEILMDSSTIKLRA